MTQPFHLVRFRYSQTIGSLRSFFRSRGYIEVNPQSRLSILSCKNPDTAQTITIGNKILPLPQTHQIYLEKELHKAPQHIPGLFCSTVSYRDEHDPVPIRHERIFDIFEFVGRGDFNDMMRLQEDLLEALNFRDRTRISHETAQSITKSPIIGIREEHLSKTQNREFPHAEIPDTRILSQYFGPAVLLAQSPPPQYKWNIKFEETSKITSSNCNIILRGVESIRSSEKSCNREDIYKNFRKMEDGKYSQKFFDLFGEENVKEELNEYLSLNLFPRFGGGCGMKRLMRAKILSGHQIIDPNITGDRYIFHSSYDI
jgi:hypothetical protein